MRAGRALCSAYERQPSEETLPGVYRAIELYRAALAALDSRTAPIGWAGAQHGLGNALRILPGAERQRNLETAVSCFEASLAVFSKVAYPSEWASTMTNLGIVWSALGELQRAGGDAGNSQRAIDYFEAALTVRSENATPGPWSLTQQNLGNAWLRLAQAGDREAAVHAMEAYRNALRVRTRAAAPFQWARTTRNLADACLVLPDELRARQLPAAIQAANAALDVLTPAAAPNDWSGAHLTLAHAYLLLTTGDRNDNLEQAIDHLDAALPLLGPESGVIRWRAQLSLADTLVDLERGDRRRNRLRAIALYRDWLAKAPSDNAERSKTLDALGVAYEAAGDLASAAASYEQASALIDAGTVEWARLQKRLGDALSGTGVRGRPRDLERALGCYESALRVYSGDEYQEQRATIQINMGLCYAAQPGPNRSAGLQRAIGCYNTALQSIDRAHNPQTWATAQFNLGNALYRLHDGRAATIQRAIGHFQAAMTVNTERDAPKAWASAQNSLGIALCDAGDLKGAAACLESALRVLTEQETPDQWARTQCNLGALYRKAANEEGTPALRTAAIHFGNALRVWTRESDPVDWARTTSTLGGVYAKLAASPDEARLAIGMGDAALAVLTRDRYPRDWSVSQDNLGRSFLDLRVGNRDENLQSALSRFALALETLDPAETAADWAAVQVDRGIAYAQLRSLPPEHNFGQALACYAASLAVYNERETPREWAATQANIGALHLELARLGVPGAAAESVKALEAALRVLSPDTNPTLWAQVHINLGTAVREQDPERALQCYQTALGTLTAANQPDLWALAQDHLGVLYATRAEDPDDQRRAVECFERELAVLTPERTPTAYLRAVSQLALTYYYGRQWSLAVTRYLEAAALAERLRTESADEDTRLHVLRSALGVFDRGMLAAVQAEQYDRALEFAERAKARNLAEQLRRAEYQPPSVAAEEWNRYQEVLRELAAERRAPALEIFDRSAAASYQASLTRLSALRQEAATLERRFAAGDPDFALADRPPDPARVASLARSLDAVIVDFRLTAEGSYAFLIGPDGVFNAENVVRLELLVKQDAIRWAGFSGVMSEADISSGRGEELVRDNYRLVMGPIRDRLRQRYPAVRRLLLIPSRMLALLPLQAARLESGDTYLLDEYEIAWAPNAAILERCVARGLAAPASASRLLAVQNPDGSLPFADWEAEEIAKLFPEDSRHILAGAEATRAAVVRNLSFGTEALFSCHAAFDTAAPEKSFLQLAGGILTLPDLLRADFRNASLIVMSACTSGVVDLQSLDVDEHFGLATACLVAGAHTVVASLWQVNDATTALLMQRFHRNLYTRAMDKARALQEAQIWLRDMPAEEAFAILEARQLECEGEQGAADAAVALLELHDRGPRPFSHPYWWAAFQCIGDAWTPAAPKSETTPNTA